MAVRTLIVDDSPTMRRLIGAMLRRDPDIEVIGEAGDPLEAREAIKRLNPDVITLDVEMPNMSGLEFLEKIMRLRPMPVVMVSTLTQAGADASIEALAIGAVDCVGKPTGGNEGDGFHELPSRVKAAAQARIRPAGPTTAAPQQRAGFSPLNRIIAIGSSTGGVEALITVLTRFPANCPPTVITQHMPPSFTRSLAERLDRLCAPRVAEASEGAPLKPGHVYVAPGGTRHLKVSVASAPRCSLVDAPPENGHCPSVDVLFRSVAQIAGAEAVGVILTGMGRDGADGLLAMRNAGAATIGQDAATSVVYGMPRVAFEIGAVQKQAPLSRIADAALDLCDSRLRKAS